MPEADNKKKTVPDDRTLAALAEVERAIEETRRSAFKLFRERRVLDGGTLNDWLTSEPEDCWPATKWVERAGEYELRIALPGFDPSTIVLTGKPHQLTIETRDKVNEQKPPGARAVEPTLCSRRLRRHVGLPVDFRADNVRATLHDGVLTIVAPKAAAETGNSASGGWRINISH